MVILIELNTMHIVFFDIILLKFFIFFSRKYICLICLQNKRTSVDTCLPKEKKVNKKEKKNKNLNRSRAKKSSFFRGNLFSPKILLFIICLYLNLFVLCTCVCLCLNLPPRNVVVIVTINVLIPKTAVSLRWDTNLPLKPKAH